MRLDQPNINGIPLSSIERIEILPSTAGGIYGGGATGGVVNVILKRGYQGLEVRGTYDGTTNGGNRKRRLEASGGFSLEGGGTSVNFAASYSDALPLLVGDRDFTANARERILRNAPETELIDFLGNPIAGYTTNIQSVSGNPLVLVSSGLSLGSARAHVPVGYAGPGSDNGLAFLNATGFNTDLPKSVAIGGTKSHALAAPTVRSISLNLRREFSNRVEAFVDLSNYDNNSLSHFAGACNGNGTTIPVGPNNPFTEQVKINLPLTSFDRSLEEQHSWGESRTLAGGVIVRLPGNWSAQGEYSWSRSRSGYTYNFYQITADGGAAIRDGRLDPFRDVNDYPLDFSPYYVSPTPQSDFGSDVVLKNATLRLAGPYPQSDTIGTSVDANQYTFGFRYQPVEQLALRASYGEGVLPPSISPPNFLALIASRYTDPKRGGQPLSSLGSFISLGSPSLRPEQSESFSAGMIFTPESIPGLRVPVNYTRIDKVDEINTINTQTDRQLSLRCVHALCAGLARQHRNFARHSERPRQGASRVCRFGCGRYPGQMASNA